MLRRRMPVTGLRPSHQLLHGGSRRSLPAADIHPCLPGINEFVLGDNTIMVEMDGVRTVFLNHNVINYMMTNNPEFISYTFETLKILQRKSMLISEISERDRQLFFILCASAYTKGGNFYSLSNITYEYFNTNGTFRRNAIPVADLSCRNTKCKARIACVT